MNSLDGGALTDAMKRPGSKYGKRESGDCGLGQKDVGISPSQAQTSSSAGFHAGSLATALPHDGTTS
jgi:hypothetical protein